MTPELAELLESVKLLNPTTRAFFVRLARRLREGYEGEITLSLTKGGIRSIRWSQLEDGRSVQDGG